MDSEILNIPAGAVPAGGLHASLKPSNKEELSHCTMEKATGRNWERSRGLLLEIVGRRNKKEL